MQLNLKTKSVRFELVDDESETTISLSSEDDQETICRKLRKVLELVKPEAVEPASLADVFAPRRERQDRAVTAGSAGGWHKAPEPPEHWKGEVEMIGEGE